jgi:pyrroloquinoline quinone biosynthesis protein B
LVIQNPATGGRVFYAPGLGAVTPELLTLMASCSVLLVDGTFWTEDEMITQGLSKKKASEMGHLPQSGAGGMIEQLDQLPPSIRKILIHINNTNPMLIEDSAERAELTRHGIEVGRDGLDIVF